MTILAVPLGGFLLRHLKAAVYSKRSAAFTTSRKYWEDLYASGGNSGSGSYRRAARFKAGVLNTFMQDQNVQTVLEWGCGDGSQLRLATYRSYVGVDVSNTAVNMCRQIYKSDHTKEFFLIDEIPEQFQSAECAISLDVVYHLVEDNVYFAYMKRLFASATRFVIIYAWNVEDDSPINGSHVRHRAFLRWVAENINSWALTKVVNNEVACSKAKNIFAHFYIFTREV
jgi:cyclopropane fatty-acyl-phospholipid synthase-like methyltransferase